MHIELSMYYFSLEAFVDDLKTGHNLIFLYARKKQVLQFHSYIVKCIQPLNMRNKQRNRDLVVISGNKWFKTLWKGALRDVEPFFIGEEKEE